MASNGLQQSATECIPHVRLGIQPASAITFNPDLISRHQCRYCLDRVT